MPFNSEHKLIDKLSSQNENFLFEIEHMHFYELSNSKNNLDKFISVSLYFSQL